MKKLGLLFGCEVLLDTDDQELADKAEKYLTEQKEKAWKYDELSK